MYNILKGIMKGHYVLKFPIYMHVKKGIVWWVLCDVLCGYNVLIIC
jgi:hypothetical protein